MTIHDDEKGKRIVTCFVVSRDQNSMNYGHIMRGDVPSTGPDSRSSDLLSPVLLLFTIKSELKAPLTSADGSAGLFSANVEHHVKRRRPHVGFWNICFLIPLCG